MIYTGYFSRLKNYNDDNLKLVSIANINPSVQGSFNIINFSPLAPGSWIYPWKADLKNRSDLGKAKLEYINTYYTKCLHKFTPGKLFKAISDFVGIADIILLCYEAPPKQMGPDGIIDDSWLVTGKTFCHRHIVSDFLRRGGYPCQEYYIETNNFGEGDLFK